MNIFNNKNNMFNANRYENINRLFLGSTYDFRLLDWLFPFRLFLTKQKAY